MRCRTPVKSLLARHSSSRWVTFWTVLLLLLLLNCYFAIPCFFFCLFVFRLYDCFPLGFYTFSCQTFPWWILEVLTTQTQQSCFWLKFYLSYLEWLWFMHSLMASSHNLAVFSKVWAKVVQLWCIKTRSCATDCCTPGWLYLCWII